MRSRRIVRATFLALVFAVASLTGAPAKGTKLPKSTRAAIDAYLAELQASPGGEGIVDPGAPELADRVKYPQRKYYKHPRYPEELRRAKRYDYARSVIAGVIELDGTVSHTKVVVPAFSPQFDEVSLAAVKDARYEGPVLVDGKPVRAYLVMVVDFTLS